MWTGSLRKPMHGESATPPPSPVGSLIDQWQRDRVHELVAASIGAGARLAAGGTYQGLFCRPPVLGNVTPQLPA